MKITSRPAPWRRAIVAVLAAALSLPLVASAADTPPPAAQTIPIAHSAQLTINGTFSPSGLVLHILHATNQIPIDGRDVTVTVDGKNQPLTVQQEVGDFLLPTKDLSDGPQNLEIVVAHDGIREILTGKVALPKSFFGSAMMDSSHKQILWWVLNIGIVLIAVLAFSNRKPKPEPEEKEED
jgi:hypothetical protein